MSSDGPRDLVLTPFDPNPSIERALDLLEAANVPFALAGRLAVWAAVPADDHEYTKDVDFAVPHEHMGELERLARERGFAIHPLAIGGFAIRTDEVRVDFIDRHIDFGSLFADGVEQALARGTRIHTTGGKAVPVVPPEYVVAMKLATGDPRDERDIERILARTDIAYETAREVARQYLGPVAANRLDFVGARVGREEAARYVRTYNGKV